MGRNGSPSARWWVVTPPLAEPGPPPPGPPMGVSGFALPSRGPRTAVTARSSAPAPRSGSRSASLHGPAANRPSLGPPIPAAAAATQGLPPPAPAVPTRGRAPGPAAPFFPRRRLLAPPAAIQPGTPLLLGDCCPGPAADLPTRPSSLRWLRPFRAHSGPSGSLPPAAQVFFPMPPPPPGWGLGAGGLPPRFHPRPPRRPSASPLSPPLWQDSCCATRTVERSASQVFIQLPPPKLPPSSPQRGRLMPGP